MAHTALRFIVAALVALTTTAPVLAETIVNGGEVGGQTWTAAGNPYRIKGDITIAAGTTLRIQPGTQVIVYEGDLQAAGMDTTAVEIIVRGELIAEKALIIPIATNTMPGATIYGYWRGIVVEPEATAVTITDSTLQAGFASIWYRHAGSILNVAGSNISNASAAIRIGFAASGVGIRVDSGAPLIERATITANHGGVVVTGGARPFVRSNIFALSLAPTIDISATDATAAPLRIFNNSFETGQPASGSIRIDPGVTGLTVDIVNNAFVRPTPTGSNITAVGLPATVNVHHNMFEVLGSAASGVTLGAANFGGMGAAAIDAGTNMVDVPFDRAGRPRPRGVAMDVGAQENPGAVTRGDANNDLKADLFWREQAGVGLSWWTMDGATLTGSNYHEVAAEWQVAEVGDFNGDGKSDLLWRRATDGAIYLWTLDGLAPLAFFDLGVLPPAAWTLVGAADVNGDGKSDLVWRSSAGHLYFWIMNGGIIASQGGPAAPLGAEWQVADLADMNGDGMADVVFRNTTTGATNIWFMTGLNIGSQASAGTLDPAQWTLLAAADFNGDHKGDLLWRNATGDTWVWIMNGGAFVSAASVGNPGLTWSVQSVSDFDGDGKADLVWRRTDGVTYYWKMNGASIASMAPITNPGGSWQVVAP